MPGEPAAQPKVGMAVDRATFRRHGIREQRLPPVGPPYLRCMLIGLLVRGVGGLSRTARIRRAPLHSDFLSFSLSLCGRCLIEACRRGSSTFERLAGYRLRGNGVSGDAGVVCCPTRRSYSAENVASSGAKAVPAKSTPVCRELSKRTSAPCLARYTGHCSSVHAISQNIHSYRELITNASSMRRRSSAPAVSAHRSTFSRIQRWTSENSGEA